MSLINLKKTNFAFGLIASSISASAPQIILQSGNASRFPATGKFRMVIWAAQYDAPVLDPSPEIVEAEFVSDETFNITRGKEDSTAHSWTTGDHVALNVTKGMLQEVDNAINNNLNQAVKTTSNVVFKSAEITSSVKLPYDAVTDEFKINS